MPANRRDCSAGGRGEDDSCSWLPQDDPIEIAVPKKDDF